ncbi:MAG TPA: GAF domain-containing protein [Thioploca sp.]|nr:GAF domain-containing protein [Thioploca sp.]
MFTLANYQIKEQIYESINSIVYRGIRNKDNKPVILKMLKQDYPTASELTRYQKEYEIIYNLDSEGVIKVYGIEKYQNILVIILEDFDGTSLKKIIANKLLTIKEFLYIAIQIADGLANIHTNNIIHKDINPSNIIINTDTKNLKIIDFGIASRLPRENPILKNPEQLEGTLAYLSPEQTGRINRSMDYRTDLYSLGVTFYELLTGQLPFKYTDAMELVHCHIAKIPVPVNEINPEIPQVISDIVMKLLAKNAEDRYQSAFGIKADLEKILSLESIENIQGLPFELAQHDFSSKFEIPQKLYGREHEVNILLQSFERVSNSNKEIVLVAGYSGVGKTALVHEVHKPMTEKQGYFAAGKFDQLQKNIPYSAITKAFNKLCHYLLLENTEILTSWQSKILTAVGNNGQIIIDVVPNLELIIGKQPPVAEVGPTESQNRFQIFFLNFIKVLCSKEHPFILFIDDLQWVDSASLTLLKAIILDTEIQHLLIIGAYRDNEIDANHPFSMAIDELQKTDSIINTIKLRNLQLNDVITLLQDTLKCNSVQDLATLVYQKTQGNAFFTHQFLHILYEEELLQFGQQQWQWDIAQIASQDITDNVVELMANKINKLPEPTSKILRLAACIGNQFDLSMLAIISELSQSKIADRLQPAITEGLIQFLDDKSQFKFLHDRVQQAAYAMIEAKQKQAVHLQIGYLLLDNISSEKLVEKYFEVVDHLNAGRELITDIQKQVQIAQLNLVAGQKAKNATAYVAALQYLTIGIKCLNDSHWSTNYTLTFDLHKEKAEVEFLNNNFSQSELLIYTTLDKAQSVIEKTSLYSMLTVQYTMLAKYEEATQAGRTALKLLDIDLPTTDLTTALQTEMIAVQKNLGDRTISSIVNATEMTEPLIRAGTQILVKLITTTYQSNQALFAVVVSKIVKFSLKYGNISESPFGYAAYGVLLGSVFGNYKMGAEFSNMAYHLAEKFHNMSQKCAVCDVLSGHAHYWTQPLQSALIYSDEGYQAGLESGELQVIGYIMMFKLYNLFSQGLNLNQLLEEITHLLALSKKHRNQLAIDTIIGCQIGVLNLTGLTTDRATFANGKMDDEQFTKECHDHQTILSLCMYQILKLQILYLYDKPTKALEYAKSSEQQINYVLGVFCVAEHNFYYSLTLIALYPSASPELQQQYMEKLQANQNQMKIWADNCQENFLHKYQLVQAEIAKIEGDILEAMDLYDHAIASAKENDFIQNEALANELAAKFWLGRNKEEISQVYLRKAQYGYQKWAATNKLELLETQYSHLIRQNIIPNLPETIATVAASTTIFHTSTILDLDSVTKASKALAGEIVLSKLLEKIMWIVIENSGAERGLLILKQDDSWLIEAEGLLDTKKVTILQSIPLADNLPISVVNYVLRTRESVVLTNARQEGIYTTDSYIQQQQAKSILCSPILHQRKIIGLLYLENNLTEGAFTSARLRIVDILSSQVAISLENSLLYQTLEKKVEQRTSQLDKANKEIKSLNELLTEENIRMRTELNVAKQLQQMVLPKEAELEEINSLDIAGFMEPAEEVGGDYYEVLHHDGRIKIGIGDVTGHGLESGVIMLMVQTTVRALLLVGIDNPETFLNIVNRTVYHNAQRMATDKNLTLSLLDYKNGTLRLTGQHEEVLLVRKNGEIERIDTFDLGFMVGVVDDITKFTSHQEIELLPEDGIVLYTDGITEAQNIDEKQYGLERLCEIVSCNWSNDAKQVQQAVIADVKNHIGMQKVLDDITLLVLKQK